jgi:GTP-dependent phosphoenolpyruvate carboxykinase
MDELLSVHSELFKQQIPQVREQLERFGDRLPAQITAQLEALEARLAE